RARRLAEFKVRESEQFLIQLLEATPVGIFVVSADRKPFYANLLAQQMLGRGISPEAAAGQLEDIYQVYLAGTDQPYPSDRRPVLRALQGEKLMVEDMEIRRPDVTIPVQVWAAPIFDSDGRVGYSLAAFIDITERKRTEELLRELSLTDDLTGLRNRRGFMLVAEQQLAYGKRLGESLLVYLDLDGLKQINDNYGHEQGSAAIIKTAEIMRQTFRTSDIMARLGGDEFVVLAVGTTSGSEGLIARLQANLAKYNEQGHHAYQLRVSVGVEAVDSQSTATLEELLARADQRMYEQKRKNKEQLPGGLPGRHK
ncbi:MAG: diguanylate cyclase, partial [Acidobacteria bacterium]|nr:diguanylate cyclase [Acidobacteriota bacterium]